MSHFHISLRGRYTGRLAAPTRNPLEKDVRKPFTKVDRGTYLFDRPQKDAVKLLIDSFRIRDAGDWDLDRRAKDHSISKGATSTVQLFRQYLNTAKSKGLLPSWWTIQSFDECDSYGESGAWSGLGIKVTKYELYSHDGHEKTSLQLRMLAEAVYGIGSFGQDGTAVGRAYL